MNKAWKLAHIFARHGIPIIPIPASQKGCKLSDWPELASTDKATIDTWMEQEPNGNFGCVCTLSGIVVLDADNPALSSYIEKQTGQTFPNTLTVKTSKAYHYYFLQTDKTREMGNRKVAEMFDLQSNRKYVVGPGSIHPSGAEYSLINKDAIIEMPDWLADFLDKWSAPARPVETKDAPELDENFNPDDWYDFNDISGHEDGDWFITDECPISGYRHEQSVKTGFFHDGNTWGFHCFASSCAGSDMSIGDVVAFINKKRRDEGLPVWTEPIWKEDDSELDGVDDLDALDEDLEELAEQEPEPVTEPGQKQEETEQAEQEPEKKKKSKILASTSKDEMDFWLVTKSAADVDMEILRWLWPQKIPQGKVVLFTGKPDCGKTLCALDVAARVSTGTDWPDGTKNENPPGKVLIAASEDDPSDTLVPRLVAAGANLRNIEIICGTYVNNRKKETKKRTTLNLKRDAKILLQAIKSNPDITLLILDPIISFFGDADTNKDKDIRPIMDELKTTCEKSGLTIVGLIHSNKRSDVDSIHKVSGAGSLASAVRAVWGFSRDTEDKKKYHMAHVKGNLSKEKSGLDYSITETIVLIHGKDVGQPRVEWGDKYEGDADDLLAASREKKDTQDSKMMIAKAILRSTLYPIKATKLYANAESEGIKVSTIKDAKRILWNEGLHLVAKKESDGWYWCDADAKEPTEQEPISADVIV